MTTTTHIPLVVDLDGALLRSDLTLEIGISFVRHQPLSLLKPFAWLLQGRAAMKSGLASGAGLDVTVLPYEPQTIEQLHEARAQGRETMLVTSSHQILADQVAEHLQLFDLVLATRDDRNLSEQGKRTLLVERYGEQGFEYVDDGATADSPGVRDWMKALRLHQWMKNMLIFVPLLAAHLVTSPELIGKGILAFLFFGLCASSVYVLNDLLDVSDDRHHKTKRNRPFAAGRLSIAHAIGVIVPVFSSYIGHKYWSFR